MADWDNDYRNADEALNGEAAEEQINPEVLRARLAANIQETVDPTSK